MSPKLKQLLAGSKVIVGTFAKIPSFHTFEALALSELDVVCIDAEHGPFDRQSVDLAVTVLEQHQKPAIVRVTELTTTWTLSPLDSGASGVMAPHICSQDDAERLMSLTSYQPGRRGFAGSTRAAAFGSNSIETHLTNSQESICRIAMIEDEAALENLEQIFTVRGIDLFFVGRVDLTVSLGETDLASPVVEDAMNLILAKALENKVSLGMFSPTSADAKLLVSRGVRFLLMGSDTMFLNRGATELTRSVTG